MSEAYATITDPLQRALDAVDSEDEKEVSGGTDRTDKEAQDKGSRQLISKSLTF